MRGHRHHAPCDALHCDDPADIASGPTVPAPSTAADARAIIDRLNMDLPDPYQCGRLPRGSVGDV
ncbi:DUF4147 domain-containing protein [Shimia sp. MIT910701]|uniref:DUF4147 domain-containing protein n=1 Tax=Shimia sp. MIT910701 TaxID=3096987 RepID=UPI00399C4449